MTWVVRVRHRRNYVVQARGLAGTAYVIARTESGDEVRWLAIRTKAKDPTTVERVGLFLNLPDAKQACQAHRDRAKERA